MICDFGDVVVVPFPFAERPLTKNRPALVLSGHGFNGPNGHTVLAMITTAARSSWPSDHPIADHESAGLRHASVVRWKLFTLPNELISRKVGRLGAADGLALASVARTMLAPS